MPDTPKITKLKLPNGVVFTTKTVNGLNITAKLTPRGARFHFDGVIAAPRTSLCLADVTIWKKSLEALIDEVTKERRTAK